LFAVDLFNHGYFWEAHEAWEGLWKGAVETSLREFLKGLIKLAAAEVKRLEGNAVGVARHRARASELFRLARGKVRRPSGRFAGASWSELAALAERSADDSAGPMIVLQ
jgi:predicted metal-dependent hydrolase